MPKHAAVHKNLFKDTHPSVQRLAAQVRKEQRLVDRALFKQTEMEAGRWTENTPKPNDS